MHIYEETELQDWHAKQKHGADGVWAIRRGKRTLFTDEANEIEAALVLQELGLATRNSEPDLMYWHHYPHKNIEPQSCWFWYMPPKWYPGCETLSFNTSSKRR